MTQRRYPSLPPLTLAVDLSSADYTIKTTQALDWESAAIVLGMFNSDYVPFCLMNDAKNRVEFGLITAGTLTALATTGATIYKRGLKTYAEGKTTDSDEVAANKLPWIAGETKLLIGTNPPWMYGTFANRDNNETITGDWTFQIAPTVPTIAPGVLTRVANLQSVSDYIDSWGSTGQLLTWSGGARTLITPGVATTVLVSNGVAAVPSFQAVGGITPIPVKDEGVQITPGVSSFDFVGAGVTATNVGNDVTVTIPGAGSVPVSDEGVQITANVSSFNFVGAGVTATAVGDAVTVTVPGGGGGTAQQTEMAIHQVAHGFSVGNVIRSSGVAGQYTKAQANTAANAEVAGIVTIVPDADDFTMVMEGYVDVAAAVPALAAGTVLYLSDTIAGALTDTVPTALNTVSKPLAVIETSNSKMIFNNYRGEINAGLGNTVMTRGTGQYATNSLPSVVTIGHGLGVIPDFIRVTAKKNLVGTCAVESVGVFNGTAQSVTYEGNFNTGNVGNGKSDSYIVWIQNSNLGIVRATATFDATNIYLSFDSPSIPDVGVFTFSYLWEAYTGGANSTSTSNTEKQLDYRLYRSTNSSHGFTFGYSDDTGQPIAMSIVGNDTGAGFTNKIYKQTLTTDNTIYTYITDFRTFGNHFSNTRFGVVWDNVAGACWESVGTFASNIFKGSTLVSISGSAFYGPLAIDTINNYLLVHYDNTHIARYSGIAGTTITYNSTITLDTACDVSIPSFVYDKLNQRYILVDTVNHKIRRFNSVGTTIDTVDYPSIYDSHIFGVCFVKNTVNLIVGSTWSPINNGGQPVSSGAFYGDLSITLVPTTMTR